LISLRVTSAFTHVSSSILIAPSSIPAAAAAEQPGKEGGE